LHHEDLGAANVLADFDPGFRIAKLADKRLADVEPQTSSDV
jgi:hypothetical protein